MSQENLILAAVPDSERFRIVRLMTPVDLPVRTVLLQPDRGDDGVYFPTAGLVSAVIAMADGAAVECSVIGAEGWIGNAAFGASMPSGLMVFQQIAGAALRMNGSSFRAALQTWPALADSVANFSGVLLAQVMQTAACNRLHDAIARCARWLLLTRDRIGRDELGITHEFLAQMLGASRSGVTATMTKLENDGLIARARASVVIVDAEGLRRTACECHEAISALYSRYLSTLGAR